MLRLTLLPLIAAALLMAVACSDDDKPNPDTGTPDIGTTDKAVTDKDQPTADAPVKQKVEKYIPAGTAVTGWTEDSSKGGLQAGYTKTDIENLIDGKHDPYAAEGCAGFAMQYYKKDFTSSCSGSVELMVWDMNTAAGAKKMYDDDKLKAETSAGLTFETIATVQTAGIIADDAPGWRVFAHKNTYIIAMFSMYSDPACKADLKTDTTKWAEVVTQNLP